MDAGTAALAAFVLAVVLLAGTTQTAAGFGGALIMAPLLVIVLEPRDVVVLTAVIGAANTALVARQMWEHVPLPTIRTLLLGSFAGMPFGLLALLLAPADALRIAVGAVSLTLAVLLAAGVRPVLGGRGVELAVGSLAGALNTSTSMNGPPVALYLQERRVSPAAFRGGMAVFLCVTNCVSLVLFAVTGVVSVRALALAAAAMPAVALGNIFGARLAGRLDPERFRALVLLLLAGASVAVIVTTSVRLAG